VDSGERPRRKSKTARSVRKVTAVQVAHEVTRR
jgi:hypothetical protein